MTKWEYMEIKAECSTIKNNSSILNELGQKGWEVIASIAEHGGMTTKLILKRPIQ